MLIASPINLRMPDFQNIALNKTQGISRKSTNPIRMLSNERVTIASTVDNE